jgi:hypothetical protein
VKLRGLSEDSGNQLIAGGTGQAPVKTVSVLVGFAERPETQRYSAARLEKEGFDEKYQNIRAGNENLLLD